MEYEENIFTTLEKTNTELVENYGEHLETIVQAFIYGVGVNLRIMAENDPVLLREMGDKALENMALVLEHAIADSQIDSDNRTIN